MMKILTKMVIYSKLKVQEVFCHISKSMGFFLHGDQSLWEFCVF